MSANSEFMAWAGNGWKGHNASGLESSPTISGTISTSRGLHAGRSLRFFRL